MTTIGSLCTGYGGLDIAAGHVWPNTRTLWTADTDPNAARLIAHRWPDAPNIGDITTTTWHDLERPDILTAGYPCQPFSTAGYRQGTDDERHIWPDIARAISTLRPAVVLLENVPGHLSLGAVQVVADLAGRGYVGSWRTLRAADVGAPHARNRLFIVATDPTTSRRRPEPRFALTGRRASSTGVTVDRARGRRGFATDPNGRERQPRPGEPRPCGRRQPGDRGSVATDTDNPTGDRQRPRQEPEHRNSFGEYAEAIERWQHVIGRPAPPARIAVGRYGVLNPRFVEWMMGLDPGWVTGPDLELSRSAQLRLLGNGVVPQQAATAIATLVPTP